MAHGQDFKKKAQQARFFGEKTAPQAKLIKEKEPQERISFDWILMGTLSSDVVYKSLFTYHKSESSLFNQLIYSLTHEFFNK